MKIDDTNSNPISKHIFIMICDILLLTPMVYGISREDSTIDDIHVRNFQETAVIPSTALMGFFRHTLLEAGEDKQRVDQLFGDVSRYIQSRLYTQAVVIKSAKFNTHNVVVLSDNGINANQQRIEHEVVEAGQQFTLQMELILHRNDNQDEILSTMKHLLYLLTSDPWSIGRMTAHGFGQMKAELANVQVCAHESKYDPENDRGKLIHFTWDNTEQWTSFAENIGSLL